MYEIRPVKTKSDWNAFIDLPWAIYKGDPHWVPPLRIAVRDMLDVKKNPFFKHSRMHPILGFKNGKCIGRVVGVVDDNHNRFHSEKTAFFGFFEATDDQAMVDLMLQEVSRWAREQGMNQISGPMNPSTNHECGLLVYGFNDSPTVMCTYNPQYYERLLEKWGFVKSKDLYAYEIRAERQMSDRLLRHAERIQKKSSVVFRPMDIKHFDREIALVQEIYNDAWEKNWGFVPMEPEEFQHLAKDMKLILDPALCLIAEINGEAVGFALSLPDVNQVFKGVKSGKLLPTGLFKILWNTKGLGRRKTISRCRILTLGIKKKYRDYGLGPLFYTETRRRAGERGYFVGEASWILEDNKAMNKALEHMCGERTKTYRIYQKALL